MSKISTTLRRFVYKIQDYFPSRLPVGLYAFNAWADRLLFTYFPPGVTPPSQDSFRFSLAAMVMHLDAQSASKSNRFFGKAIQKGAANEVASYVMHDLKAKREALIKAQQETSTQAEATAQAVAVSGQPGA